MNILAAKVKNRNTNPENLGSYILYKHILTQMGIMKY